MKKQNFRQTIASRVWVTFLVLLAAWGFAAYGAALLSAVGGETGAAGGIFFAVIAVLALVVRRRRLRDAEVEYIRSYAYDPNDPQDDYRPD